MRLWDLTTGACLTTYRLTGVAEAATITADGTVDFGVGSDVVTLTPRPKGEVAIWKKRIVTRDQMIEDLSEFKVLGSSGLAAQHDDIERLRRQVAVVDAVGGCRPL